MGNLLRFFLHPFQDETRAQAMAFERARTASLAEPFVSADDVRRALAGREPIPMFELPDGSALDVDRAIRRLHQLHVGATGSGKSYGIVGHLLDEIDRAIEQLLRRPERDDERLPLELRIIDVKSETVRLLKQGIAARYLRGAARVRRAIQRSAHAIEWRRDAITPVPLLSPSSDVSPEYEAELKTDILIRTSRQEWPESVRYVFFQFLRICKAIHEQPHPIVFRELFHDERARAAALPKITAPDLRDFLGGGVKVLRPQTIEAVERRIAIEFAYPQIHLSTFLPHADIVRLGVPVDAPIVLADCGSTDLPPSIGMARANLLATDAFFAAMRRDPAVGLLIFLEEALLLFSYNPHLLSRVLDALRVLRSTNTAVHFAAQGLDALPKAAVRELVTNIGAMTAYQGRADVADILAPHVASAAGAAPRRAREVFQRELAGLKPREAYLWVKSAGGALRVRARELPDAAVESGVSADELLDVFDREITPRSRVSVATARSLIEVWERGRAARPTPPSTPKNVRSFLGLDGDDDV